MNKNDARNEIANMKAAASPAAYHAALAPVVVKLSESTELPTSLSDAHALIENARIALAESNLNGGRLAVATAVASDNAQIKTLLEAGKLTVPVANAFAAIFESRRADQIIALAEGDMPSAQGADADVNSMLSALGQLPATVSQSATPVDPTKGLGAPAEVSPDPTAPGDGQVSDDQIDALARQLMREQGMSYSDAVIAAQQQLSGDAGQGGAMPKGVM